MKQNCFKQKSYSIYNPHSFTIGRFTIYYLLLDDLPFTIYIGRFTIYYLAMRS